MCNCSKPIAKTDCQRLRKCNSDPLRRFFIYHIFDDARGLMIANVPKGENPNAIALERGFINSEGFEEWYKTTEHPCLFE